MTTTPATTPATTSRHTDYVLRYSPDGQIRFNDPRLGDGLADILDECALTIDVQLREGSKPLYSVALFLDHEDAVRGQEWANITGVDSNPVRALRNAMGWAFGSKELVDGAVRYSTAFHATSHTDTILD